MLVAGCASGASNPTIPGVDSGSFSAAELRFVEFFDESIADLGEQLYVPDIDAEEFVALGRLACGFESVDEYTEELWNELGVPKGRAEQLYREAKHGSLSQNAPDALCRDPAPTVTDDDLTIILNPLSVACFRAPRDATGEFPGGCY